MKYTLLFLILFTLPAQGQDTALVTTRFSVPSTPTWIFDGGVTSIVYYDGDTVRTTMTPYSVPALLDWLKLAEAYAKECYDDSTQINSWGGPDIQADTPHVDSLGRKVIEIPAFHVSPSILLYHSMWTHREPTFPGFIDYLRRRLTP